MMQPTNNINVLSTTRLITPQDLQAELPISEEANQTVVESREAVKQILSGEDKRIIAVVGPCSIHNRESGLEYARQLSDLARKVDDRILVVMRVYFEKPRTTVGWKGLINDPHLDDTFDIPEGLRLARSILLEIAEMGLPAATEMLEPITPQYIADLITLASIGARTTESPTHRQMASGLSMPVGYKNGTDGDVQVAVDAMAAARAPHAFLGIDTEGRTCLLNTKGNPWGHLILRGGRSGANFSAESLARVSKQLDKAGASPRMLVDCSHANSGKDPARQRIAWNDVIGQRVDGNQAIIGLMLESNLKSGNQKLGDPAKLEYGLSITDGCIDWAETEELISTAYDRLPPAAV